MTNETLLEKSLKNYTLLHQQFQNIFTIGNLNDKIV